jgi:putative inorganic carbon (hco3(-)) transporter
MYMSEQRKNLYSCLLGGSFILWAFALLWTLAGMQILLFAVISVSLLVSAIQRERPFAFHPFYIFAAIYLLAGLGTLLFSWNIHASFMNLLSNDWVILTVPFIGSLALTGRWRTIAFQVLILSAVLAGLYGIFQYFSGMDLIRSKMLGQFRAHYRAVGAYGSFLSFAGNQLMVFACAYGAFLLTTQNRIRKFAYLAAAGIIFLSILASQSRSTWLAIPVILFFGIIAVPKKHLLVTVGVLAVLGMAVIGTVPEISARFMSIFNLAQNETRLNLWRTSLAIIADHPVLGIGSGTFNAYFEIYRIPGFYDAQGHAHNDYLNKAVSGGLTGLISWIGMWVAWFVYMIRLYVRLPDQDADKKIVLGSILAVCGILVAAVFQCYFTDLENNIVWWFLAALGLQVAIQKRKTQQLSG